MATTTKDETYDNFASPKPGVELMNDGEHKPVRGASFAMLFLISSPRMPIQMAWAAQWAALGPFLGTLLPPFAVQLTQLVGPLTGILVAPVVGVLSDRSTNSWGRRRPLLMYGAITSAVCWILMGFTKEMGEALGDYGDGTTAEESHTYTAIFVIIFYTWMDSTVNVVQTPCFLMIADFAGDRQTTGSSLGQGWSTVGAVIIAAYISWFGAPHLTLKSFLTMLAVVMVVNVFLVCAIAKETPLDKSQASTDSTCSQIGAAFGAIYQGLVTLPGQLLVYAVLMFLSLYGWTAYSGNKGQFFGLEVYDGEATGAGDCGDKCTEAQDNYNKGVKLAGGTTDLIFNIVSYIYLLVLPFLVKHFGVKIVLTLAMIPQSLLMIMAFTMNATIDVIIVVLVSFTGATIFALMVPFIIAVMGEDADIGMYVGAINSANCFGQLLNFIVGSAIINTSLGYKLPVFIGGVFSFMAVIVSAIFIKVKLYAL